MFNKLHAAVAMVLLFGPISAYADEVRINKIGNTYTTTDSGVKTEDLFDVLVGRGEPKVPAVTDMRIGQFAALRMFSPFTVFGQSWVSAQDAWKVVTFKEFPEADLQAFLDEPSKFLVVADAPNALPDVLACLAQGELALIETFMIFEDNGRPNARIEIVHDENALGNLRNATRVAKALSVGCSPI